MRMGGQMGNERVTVQNLQVIEGNAGTQPFIGKGDLFQEQKVQSY